MTCNAFEYELTLKNQVLNLVLDLDFIVFGGVVRSRIQQMMSHKELKEKYGRQYYTKKYDPEFEPETLHIRTSNFNDIDCICSFDAYKKLMSTEVSKLSNFTFRITKGSPLYPINGIKLVKGEIEFMTVEAIPKIQIESFKKKYQTTDIRLDIFIYRQDKYEYLINSLWKNLDFICNGYCIHKDNGRETLSLLKGIVDHRYINGMENIYLKMAILHSTLNPKIYHRVYKMLKYKWKVEIGKSYNFTNGSYSSILLYISNNYLTCAICNQELPESDILKINVIINNILMHFECYVKMSASCYETVNLSEKLIEEIDDLGWRPECIPNLNDTSMELDEDKEEDKEEDREEDREDVSVDSITQEEKKRLDKFIEFTKSREQMVEKNINVSSSRVHVINNTMFIDGVAIETSEEEREQWSSQFEEEQIVASNISLAYANVNRFHLRYSYIDITEFVKLYKYIKNRL